MDFKNLTHAALLRFAEAVDTVMVADQLDAKERRDLVCYWAYRCTEPGMPENLAAAIARCQGDPDDLMITASNKIDAVTGETVPFNSTIYT